MALQGTHVTFDGTLAACELWQTRPEFDELCDWWNKGAAGVFSLIGPGGSGKTAILERFVRILSPDAIQDNEDNETTIHKMPINGGIFVSSLDRETDPRHFADRIHDWISQDCRSLDETQAQPRNKEHISGFELCEKVRQSRRPILIIIDGVEAIQALEGDESISGLITNPDIREVLSQIASGNIRNAAAVVTSRYLLSDFLWKHYNYYKYTEVKNLPPHQCITLLKQRGVVGTSQDLHEIAESCGYHAFTVCLSGRVVAERYDGVAAFALAAGLPALIRGTQHGSSVGVKFQGERFRNILNSYRDVLKIKYKASHDILERLSQFRHGASEDLLNEIFVGKNWLDRRRRRKFAGPVLPYLTREKLTTAIDILCTAQLVQRAKDGRVIVHRAIGDCLALNLDENASREFHIRICRAMNQRIPVLMRGVIGLDKNTIAQLGGPFSFAFLSATLVSAPKDSYTLDCMEEYLHHAMLAGHWREAWRFYWTNMLGYLSLGLKNADFARGYRICRLFWSWPYPTDGGFICDFDPNYEAAFVNEWGLYLAKLGMTDLAVAAFNRAVRLSSGLSDKKARGVCLTNLSYIEYQRGELKDALSHAEEAVHLFDHGEGDHFLSLALVQHIKAMLGRPASDASELRAPLEAWNRYASRVVTYSSVGDPGDRSSTVSRARMLPLESPRRIAAVFPFFLWQIRDLESQDLDTESLKPVREVGALHKSMIDEELGRKSPEMLMANLMLSKISLSEKNFDAARNLARAVYEESCVCTYPEIRCLSLLGLAEISFAEVRHSSSVQEVNHAAAFRLVRDAKNIALESGLGMVYLMCLLEEGFGALMCGQFELAGELSQRVLGTRPIVDDATRSLPITSAYDIRCQYRLGILRARLLKIEASIIRCCRAFQKTKIKTEDAFCHNIDTSAIRMDLGLCEQEAELAYDAKIVERLAQISQALNDGFIETFYPIEATPISVNAERIKSGPSPMLQNIVKIGIVIALQEEFEELFAKFGSASTIMVDPSTKHHFYIFDVIRNKSGAKTKCAAVCIGDMGPEAAALVTERLITLLNPMLVVNIGIAGGLSPDASLGDVVVGSQVDNYLYRGKAVSAPQPGGSDFGFEFGGEVYMSPTPLIRTIKNLKFSHVALHSAWEERCKQARRDLGLPFDGQAETKAIVGHIASGPILSATADFGRWLKTRDRNILAVEMEAAGVMKAVLDRVHSTKSLVLRGISDYGDERKSDLDATRSGGYRRFAMRNAMEFLALLVECQALD